MKSNATCLKSIVLKWTFSVISAEENWQVGLEKQNRSTHCIISTPLLIMNTSDILTD